MPLYRYRMGYPKGDSRGGLSALAKALSFGWDFTTDGSDVLGAQDLTAVNSPVFGATGVDLESTSAQYLQRADEAALRIGNQNWSMSLFFTPEATNVRGELVNKSDLATKIEWYLEQTTTGQLLFSLRQGSPTTEVAQTASTGGLLISSTTYHIVVTVDVATPVLTMQIVGVETKTDATWTGSPGTTDTAFTVGARTAGDINADGIIKYLYIWKGYLLTAADVTALNNSGAGLAYPF